MKIQNNTLKINLAKVFLSFFGCGYFPKAPGTFGSLATIPLIIFLSYKISFIFLVIGIILLILLATFSCEFLQKELSLHDPGWIVMDEVIGMLVTWAFIFPSVKPIDLLIVFVTFRIFDIKKIWPATYFDKKVTHGFGTIFDDVISGIYAGLCTLLIKNLILIN